MSYVENIIKDNSHKWWSIIWKLDYKDSQNLEPEITFPELFKRTKEDHSDEDPWMLKTDLFINLLHLHKEKKIKLSQTDPANFSVIDINLIS